MNPPIEHFYESIGQSAADFLPDLGGKLLVYAEAENGVISVGLVYQDQGGSVRFRFAPEELEEEVYSFWEAWKDVPGNEEWRAMWYSLEGGKFQIHLVYPEQIDPTETSIARRTAIIAEQFGDAAVDYSQP